MGFYVGNARIQWYGVIIGLAIVVAFFIVSHLYKKRGYNEDIVYHMLLVIVPLAILGARLMYVIFSPYQTNFFAFREGGLAIYGGVIVAIFTVWAYAKIRKTSMFALTDAIVVALILAHAIGRWGNFTNIMGGMYEAYGVEMSFHFFPLTVMVRGTPHFAFFFWESLLNVAGFLLLWRIFFQDKPHGTTTAVYFIYYGVVRAVLEFFRSDVLLIGSNDIFINRISILISFGLIAFGGLILYLNRRGVLSQDTTALLPKEEKANEE